MKFDKMSRFSREGRRVVYNGKEYRVASRPLPGMIKITSFDEEDLNDGFYCDKSKEYMEKHGFRCHKDVPKNEITETFEIEFTAKYKGELYVYVDGWIGGDCENKENSENIVRIMTCVSRSGEPEKYEYCMANGFIEGMPEGYSLIDLYKYVNINDPELEITETRTELDIDKL